MVHESREEPLNERAQQLLRVLIESYIRDGQPACIQWLPVTVGSKRTKSRG